MDQKLLKLNTLLKAIKKDVVTPQDIMGFISVFLDEVKKTKDSLEVLTEEKLAYLDSVLKQFEEKRADLLEGIDSSIKEREKYLTDEFGNSIDALTSSVSSEITPLRDALTESIKEAKLIIKQLKNVKIKDGVDGKDADETLIVEKVLEKIVLPEYKDVALDSGEQIVDKINALDLSDDNKIDASHIKNLPEPKMIGGGSTARNLYQLGDVSLSNPTNGQVLKYNSTTGLWENGTGGGGGGTVETIVAGSKILVDAADPANPIVSVDTLTLNDISDVTATSTEVNILTGTVVTSTELNFLEGVASNIQSQINTKSSKSFAIAMAVAL